MNRLHCVAALLGCLAVNIRAQEAVMEEVRVEASFSASLESPNNGGVDLLTRRLRDGAEAQREFELQIANRNPVSTLLGLTSFVPIPLGSSDNRIDTFFLQNYMRADLNPPKANPLFESKK